MHIPCATYRLQLNSEFNFKDANSIIDYLYELGISDIYASPVTRAKKGSMHGYDVVEPDQLNPELGSINDFEELSSHLKKRDMYWLQDIVPNHMSYSNENQMLIDLLENGTNSRYFNYFDIEWNHPLLSVKQRLLAPFLGKFYQDALENCEIQLNYDSEGFNVNYYELRLPLRMESYIEILSMKLKQLRNKLGKSNPDMIKLMGVLYILKTLPSADDIDDRYDQIRFIKAMMYELYCNNENIKSYIGETLTIYNGEKNNPDSFNQLDKLLADQHFRLAYWKVATDEINYRRFFTVNELICLRVEREDTFNRTHSMILKFLKEEKINGLRIDHIDGLYDPSGYLNRLRERAEDNYIIVEKILEHNEKLPSDWKVQGTTGYEFTNYVNGLFIKKENEKALNNIYVKFTRMTTPYEEISAERKLLIIRKRMAGDVERLAYLIEKISSTDRYGIDITMLGIKEALDRILTYFPIYRTYINSFAISDTDKKYITEVIETLCEKYPDLVNELNYIGNMLLLKFGEHFSPEQKENTLDFIMRFQQLTGPLMAKGFEDTLLYVYNRFISLNEVGGNPQIFGIELKDFHEFNEQRLKDWSNTLNTTSTHDTKRGEDVRARINVLSEIPMEWIAKIKYWSKINNRFKRSIKGISAPHRNDEYFLYQTLVGSFPDNEEDIPGYKKRLNEYIIKASREAKTFTAWLQPNVDYEKAYLNFAEKILSDSVNNLFMKDFIPFQKRIACFGMLNSISQLIIKLTSPGIPDIYQGTELWDLSLVDPDNRRPVDYELRKNMLSSIKSELPGDLFDNPASGKIKLFILHKMLQARKEMPDLFQYGEYFVPEVMGKFGKNIITFGRKLNEKEIVVIAPRFLTELIKQDEKPLGINVWQDTTINLNPNICFRDYLSGKEIDRNYHVGEILSELPVALLIN